VGERSHLRKEGAMKRSRTRLLVAAVAVLVPLGALAGTSGASRPSSKALLPTKLVYTQGYKDTVYNRYGQVVATYSKDGIAIGESVPGPLGPAEITPSHAPAAGCMVHDQFVTAKLGFWSTLPNVAFKYHVTGTWCWDSSYNLTSHTLSASFTNVASYAHVDTATAEKDGYHYEWMLNPTGGYYGYAEGSAHVGTLGQVSPYVEIWMVAGPWCTGVAGLET
jgi:hypothetical protein